MMNFSQKNICFNVQGNNKNTILTYIANHAYALGLCDNAQGLLADLKKREAAFPTGLQDGFAIPHARSKHVLEASILFLKTEQDIEWGTMDDKKVNCLFSLLVPEENEGNVHLMMLSRLATCLLEEDFKAFVKTYEDKQTLVSYIYKGMEEEK